MNNYQAAAAAAHSFAAPSASPHTTTTRQGFPSTNSPVPAIDMYSSTAADNVGYVQATSPQPSGFPIAVSRAPLNYSPVSMAVCSTLDGRRTACFETNSFSQSQLLHNTVLFCTFIENRQ